MMRGTTPTLTFGLPIEATMLAVCYITFQEEGEIIFEKTLDDCRIDGCKLHIDLTQEDTLKFSNDAVVDIQIRGRTMDGMAIASRYCRTCAKRIMKEGVI